jgi:LysM repeat protein
MKTPTKKSSVEKSKSKKKSPLLKYQTAGFGGSDSYSGFDKGLDYQGLDFNFTPTSDPTLASPQRYEGASVMPGSSSQAMPTASSPSAGAIAGSVTGAMSGIGSSVMAGLQDTSVKDPSGYFNQSTINRIERARKGQKEAGIASGIGTTISSIAPMTGPAAPFLLAIGALTTAGSEIARASYKGTEGKTIGNYDERVRQRNLQKQRRNRMLQQQNMYSQPNYYDLGETGGLKKYMGGGFTKVTGPPHENGGVPMDLSGDGVLDSELEGGEIIETMQGGGKSGQKYIWSDHLKKGGKSFAKNFEEMKRKGKSQAAIEGLRVDQEIAANRDPNMLYAKYGGMMNYMKKGGVLNYYQTAGTERKPSTYIDALSNMPQDSIINPKYPSDTDVAMSKLEEMFPFLQYGNKDYSRDQYQKAMQGAKLYLTTPMTDQKRIEREENTVAAKPLTEEELYEMNKTGYYRRDERDKTGLKPKIPNRYTAKQIQLDEDTRNSGMMIYQNGGKMNYMKEGGKLPKDVLKSRLESHMSEGEAQNYIDSYKGGGLWDNIHAKRKRIAAGSEEKMRKPGSEGAPTAKALRESKRDGGYLEYKKGGLMKYQTAGTYTVQAGDSLSAIAQAQGVADYNEIYNLNKAIIGSDPGMIKPGQVLTMPGAAPAASPASPAAPVSTRSYPLAGYAGVHPLAGYPGSGGTGYVSAPVTPYTRPSASSTASTPPPKDPKSIRKELPYGIAAAGALGQIATVASIDAKKGVAPINVPYINQPEKEYFTRVRDTGKAGREAERRATIREINKATGPQKFAVADQARATLLREEEKAKANIDAMNTQIEQAEIALNTSRKDSIDFKNSEIALRNAVSTRDEALRVLESVNNKKKAYGDIFRGATKDILQYYSAEELARATEGERGVMGRFYDNPYDKFSKQYKKQNPGASPQETYAAFQTSLT